MLACRFGTKHLEDIEDAVQSAQMAALENWTLSGQPRNPSAWLFRVANNHLLSGLRQRSRRNRILQESVASESALEVTDDNTLHEQGHEGLLRMLFVTCDESIPTESQIVLALKVLCGFDVHEIAVRLFATEANVYKRLTRARNRLRELILPDDLESGLTAQQYSSRVPNVHKVIYFLFTEGYLSSNATTAIRRELCSEAIRLATTLAGDPVGQVPETYALLALMQLHAARITSRVDGAGGLLLLEEQDRALWDQEAIEQGLQWLGMSAGGDTFSRYHAEAGIAAEHCLAPSFSQTRWDRVVECYALLQQVCDSPIHMVNQAIALSQWKGAAAGLAFLEPLEPPSWLSSSYLWNAVLAYLHQQDGNAELASQYHHRACDDAPTPAVRALLIRRFNASTLNQ